jgi:exosortase/archaeosortase family protein
MIRARADLAKRPRGAVIPTDHDKRAARVRPKRYGLPHAGAVFAALIVTLYYLVSLLGDAALEPTATACAAILSTIGQEAAAYGNLVRGPDCRFEIVGECTAVFPIVLLISAILAFPSSYRAKWVGLLVFVPTALAANQLRLVTLWFVQRHAADAFDVIHIYVWQPLMVVIVVALFVLWLEWKVVDRAPDTDKLPPGDHVAVDQEVNRP